jgi:ribose transport system substrate-binding protein
MIRITARRLILSAGIWLIGATVVVSPSVASALDDFNAKVDKLYADGIAEQTSKPPSAGPKGVPGKTIVNIPCAMAAEGCARIARAIQEGAGVLGWKSILIDPAGDPSKMADAVQKAISVRADAIFLSSIDSNVIKSALQEAKEAGIKIIGTASGDPEHMYDAMPFASEVFIDDGYKMAATGYKMQGYKLHAIVMRDQDFYVVENRTKGGLKFIEECKAAGGDCSLVVMQNFLVGDLGTRLPQQTANLVRQHPDFNVLLPGYDAALNFMIQGLSMSGLTDNGIAIGGDANVANLEIIRNDGFQKASVGIPLEWVAYGGLDDLNRLLSGDKPAEQNITTKILIKSNLPASGAWIGDVDFRAAYKKIWSGQ